MSYPKLTPIIAKGATEPRYLEDRFRDVINVKDYGAVGDGETNDTTAIVNALAAGEGKAIFFPNGKYYITSRITVQANRVLFAQNACLYKPTINTSCLEIVGSDVIIDGFEITSETERDVANDNNTSLILVHDVTEQNDINDIKIINCYIHNSGAYGINLQSNIYPANNISILNCHIHDVCVGIKNGGGINYEKIDNCHIYNTKAECVTFDGYYASRDAITGETSGLVPVRFATMSNCSLRDNDAGVGLIGADNCQHLTIANCILRNKETYTNLQNGVTFNRHEASCYDVIILGCHFYGCKRGIWCRGKDLETPYPYVGVAHLSAIGNNFVANETDICIEDINGRNTFENTYTKNDMSEVFDISDDNLYKILDICSLDVEQTIDIDNTMFDSAVFSKRETVSGFNTIVKTKNNVRAYISLENISGADFTNEMLLVQLPRGCRPKKTFEVVGITNQYKPVRCIVYTNGNINLYADWEAGDTYVTLVANFDI